MKRDGGQRQELQRNQNTPSSARRRREILGISQWSGCRCGQSVSCHLCPLGLTDRFEQFGEPRGVDIEWLASFDSWKRDH